MPRSVRSSRASWPIWCLWNPAFFGVRPALVIKGGVIAYAAMGDPGASIPTPQPIVARPMFAPPRSPPRQRRCTSLLLRRWRTASPERLAVRRRLLPVRDVRSLAKSDLPRNGALPAITVTPDTFDGDDRRRADRAPATGRAADGAAATSSSDVDRRLAAARRFAIAAGRARALGGLEAAVRAGLVRDLSSLDGWLRGRIGDRWSGRSGRCRRRDRSGAMAGARCRAGCPDAVGGAAACIAAQGRSLLRVVGADPYFAVLRTLRLSSPARGFWCWGGVFRSIARRHRHRGRARVDHRARVGGRPLLGLDPLAVHRLLAALAPEVDRSLRWRPVGCRRQPRRCSTFSVSTTPGRKDASCLIDHVHPPEPRYITAPPNAGRLGPSPAHRNRWPRRLRQRPHWCRPVPALSGRLRLGVVTNDIYTTEDADFLRRHAVLDDFAHHRRWKPGPAPTPPSRRHLCTSTRSRPWSSERPLDLVLLESGGET